MPPMGVEPILLTELEPKSSVSANSTKRTKLQLKLWYNYKKQIGFRLILYSSLLLCCIDDKSELKGATSKLLTTGFLPNAMTGLSTCNFHPSFRILYRFNIRKYFLISRLWATHPLLCVIVVFLQHHSEGDWLVFLKLLNPTTGLRLKVLLFSSVYCSPHTVAALY